MVSGFRKDNKEKMTFVKDKKQLILLVVVFILLFFAVINMFRQMNSSSSNIFADNSNTSVSTDSSSLDSANLSQDAQEILNKTEELKKEIQEDEENSQIVSDIDISSEKALSSKEKTVSFEVDSTTNKVNPFLPTEQGSDIIQNYSKPKYVRETVTVMQTPPLPRLPKVTYPVYVAPPPLYGDAVDPTARELDSTTISGIMYDKYSPSAVIKVKGTDFLVKKGDIIKGFKILDISKDGVRIQYGKNIYWGTIGQLLEKSDLDYTKNISNISSKFGGNDVTISVKKK